MDHPIFLAREEETHHLASLVAVYRGVMLYGESGAGKSSLINAGLLPRATGLGFHPERVRVQPLVGQELVIERIAIAEDDSDALPSLLCPDEDSSRVVLSTETFEERLRAVAETERPLIVFDQFEEVITLFDERGADEAQRRLVDLILTLLREPLPVKLLFAFREDHLGKVKELLADSPELVDQALRLTPPSADALPTIIRGPFERYPGHFERELSPEVSQHLCDALADRFGAGDLSLSEVQVVCARLWQADDPAALLAEKGVQGLLEDYLGEALDAFPPDLRGAAIALLSEMVTSAGTRNVMSADDLIERVREEDDDIPRPLLEHALERLESKSRLIRRERRRDLYLYEITSEFLLPWIRERRDEFRRMQERLRERRRIRRLGLVAGGLLLVAALVGVLAIWALNQRSTAEREADAASALALVSAAEVQQKTRPDVSLELALAAYEIRGERPEVRDSMLGALTSARRSDAVGILHGHTNAVRDLVFGGDGTTLTSVGNDGTVRRWSTRTNRQLGQPQTIRPGSATALSLSPDARTVVSASYDDDAIRLWNPQAERQVGGALKGQAANAVALSPDGRLIASAGFETSTIEDSIRIWDARTHRVVANFPSPASFVADLEFSPSGRLLAAAGNDGRVRLWRAGSWQQLTPLRGRSDVNTVAFSPDGRTLAAAGQNDGVRIWDVRSHREIGQPLAAKKVSVMAFNRSAPVLATGGGTSVRLWDLRTHRPLGNPLTGHIENVDAVAFSRNGRTLASADFDGVIRLWDVRSQMRGGRVAGPSATAEIAISPDGKTLASSAREDGLIHLWDTRSSREVGPPLAGHPGGVIDMAFSPDGKTLASAGFAGDFIQLWDVDSHRPSGRLTGQSPTAVTFSPRGDVLASVGTKSGGFEHEVWLWDVDSESRIGRIPGAADYTGDIAFNRSGRILASADDDSRIRLWDVRAEKQLKPPLTGHTGTIFSLAFRPDGRTLVSRGSDTLRAWDVRTHRKLKLVLTGQTDTILAFAYSPDGRTLAYVSDSSEIRLWDVAADRPLGRPITGDGGVPELAFSSDGRSLVTVGQRIRFWKNIFWQNLAQLRKEVCPLVGGSLSRAEWAQYAPGIDYQKTCP